MKGINAVRIPEVNSQSTGPDRRLAQDIGVREERGREHDLYCDGSCTGADRTVYPGKAAQLSATHSQLQLLEYLYQTIWLKQRMLRDMSVL